MFDTAIGTSNRGDDIIFESAKEAISPLLDHNYVMELETHINNLGKFHYLRGSQKIKFVDNCDYKFILGTNLLSANLVRSIGQWPIGPVTKRVYKNVIMMGVGITKSNQPLTAYSKWIYRNILRKDIALIKQVNLIGNIAVHFLETIASVPGLNKILSLSFQSTEGLCIAVNPYLRCSKFICHGKHTVFAAPDTFWQLGVNIRSHKPDNIVVCMLGKQLVHNIFRIVTVSFSLHITAHNLIMLNGEDSHNKTEQRKKITVYTKQYIDQIVAIFVFVGKTLCLIDHVFHLAMDIPIR